jgi:Rrf2 family protein
MLGISSKVDYGIIIIADLAKAKTNEFVSLNDIAEDRNLSANYLAQIVLPLKKAGIIESKEGKYGGHKLAKPLSKISLAEFIRALDGDIVFVHCLADGECCQKNNFCISKEVWRKVQNDFVKYAEKKSLKKLFNL